MEKSRIFWIFILIGFLCVVIFYLQSKVNIVRTLKENFATTTTTGTTTATGAGTTSTTATGATGTTGTTATGTTATGTTATGTTAPAPAPAPVSNTLVTIPQPAKIGMYINAFLDLNGYSSTYQISGWEDTYKPSTIEFKFGTGVPPTALTTSGFPTKSISLLGPSSRKIAGLNEILSSFTIAFYMEINNNITFPKDSANNPVDIELLQVFMQTPYYVIFYVIPDKTNPLNVSICAVVGNAVYTWILPISSLVTGKMFSFVVNTTINTNTPSITLYINDKNMNITSPPTITKPTNSYTQNLTLGVGNIIINQGGYLDANMWAFIYYNSVLSDTDIGTLYTYFEQQKSGFANAMLQLKQQANAAAAAKTNITDLKNTVDDCNNLTNELKAKTCTTESANTVQAPPKPNWSIKAGSPSYSSVSDSDLEKCSPLHVNKFGESKINSGGYTPRKITVPPTTKSIVSNAVNNPVSLKDVANTVLNTIDNTPSAYISASTPNYANPASVSFSFDSIKSWLFG